jgi:hypothetical protein
MRILHASFTTLLLIPALGFSAEVPETTLRTAAQKGLALLEKTSPTFIKKGGCNSCHNQMLPAAAQAFARQHGIATGETIAQLPPEVSEATTERIIEYSTVSANSLGYELFAYAAAHRPADARIEAQVYSLKATQESEGRWRTPGNRPPITFDDFTTTAYAIYALNTYTPATQRADTDARIARARSWLLEATPRTTHERAFQLLGLAWSKAGRDSLEKAARAIEAAQRKDGGWSQLAAMPSDAYATGMSLYALYVGGAPVSGPVYQNGLRYLLDTQAPDGTWHVATRSLPTQPYFESGYPYGHDQWISAAGAAYATMAIAAAVEPQRSASR